MRPTSVVRKPLVLGNNPTFAIAYGVGVTALLSIFSPMFGYAISPFALGVAVWAWSNRASDIVFDATGLTIVGRTAGRRTGR